ncbi:hypothetical protein FIBSPDRAFT_947394 [Athelia psychrophila]|uniref:Uncharacterized protein n=1 Tax=Athelia psychrophila TaxID=1759441 RepID=A0A166S4D1_9AGAM|nr:hypothetical protein FIBSPDRAFT_947394 [Fibularhizoctonia sp. CBS 109695]
MAKAKQASTPTPKVGASIPEGVAVQRRTLGQSWIALPAQTRTKFSLGLLAISVVGIFASDWLEEKIPVPSTDQK